MCWSNVLGRQQTNLIGLGYIGLPTAVKLAKAGHKVCGIDIDTKLVDSINKLTFSSKEPNLVNELAHVINDGSFFATEKIQPADNFIVAVPTPFDKHNNAPDLTYIYQAIDAVAKVLKIGNLVLIESTVPVGTTSKVNQRLFKIRPDLYDKKNKPLFNIAHCPERVLPGSIMTELVKNDRIIGGITQECSKRAKNVYLDFVEGECLICSSAETAEMCKLTENSFRDVNIAFANEISILASKNNVDVWELRELVNRHPRVDMLYPGPGVGGHCIAVDPLFLAYNSQAESQLISAARKVNENKTNWVIRHVEQMADKNKGSRIVCLGLTFKPDVDDIRESPSLKIYEALRITYPSNVVAVEPNLNTEITNVDLIDMSEINFENDILVLLVDHKEFSRLRPSTNHFIDTKGLWK